MTSHDFIASKPLTLKKDMFSGYKITYGYLVTLLDEFKQINTVETVLQIDDVETLIELHKHLDICGHNINSNLKERLREIINRKK